MTDQQEWIVAWFAAGGIFLSIYGTIRIVCWIIKKIKKVNMTQDFKKKLCDAGCTLHGTGECGYDTRGIEQNCPYFNYILSGYMLMERELLAWAKERMGRLEALFKLAPSSAVAGKYDAMKELIEKIESL